jgi:hypothetical protein
MTPSLVVNIVFAALVLVAIPGMLAWAIRTSRNDSPRSDRAVRRPVSRPSFHGPRLSVTGSRREPGRAPVRDAP